MIRAAMIGFGGIAQSHKNSYLSLEKRGIPVKLVAICDIALDKAQELEHGGWVVMTAEVKQEFNAMYQGFIGMLTTQMKLYWNVPLL